MAHFAKIVDGVVTDVIVINDLELNNAPYPESEALGLAWIAAWPGSQGHTNWKQTSINNSFRGAYAFVGGTYDSNQDTFIEAKPPVPMPEIPQGFRALWDEVNQEWDIVI